MIRDTRNKNNFNDDFGNKIIKYASIGVAILAVIVIGLLIYGKNLNDEVKQGTLSGEQLASIVNNTENKTASTDMGKTVEEAKNEINNTANETNTTNVSNNANTVNTANTTNTTNSTNKVLTTTAKDSKTNSTTQNTATENKSTEKTESNTNENKAQVVELNFAKPVEGEIVKDFAKENLIFSETLQEWTVHTGIDIKAEKTTVVKSAEAGTVKSIKNDPRYGLTIVVEHANGFQTVYSNLLTSEFVVEGEKVEKGQSLGTVGNTAAFEIADEPHLHFEILKDSIQVDPNIYLK